MNKNTKIILLIVGIIILGIFTVNYVISANLFAPGNNNNNKYIYNETEDIKQHQINNQTYITPKNYQLGRINENVYKSSNLCDNTILKPINGLEVDYGSKVPEGLPCARFIQSP